MARQGGVWHFNRSHDEGEGETEREREEEGEGERKCSQLPSKQPLAHRHLSASEAPATDAPETLLSDERGASMHCITTTTS